jgi:hypothetical protein
MEQTTATRRKGALAPTATTPRSASATLWVLRLLVRGGILTRLLRFEKRLDDEVRKTLEMPELDKASGERAIRARLSARLAEVEAVGAHDDGVVFQNLQALAKLFQLTPTERDLVTLGARSKLSVPLS